VKRKARKHRQSMMSATDLVSAASFYLSKWVCLHIIDQTHAIVANRGPIEHPFVVHPERHTLVLTIKRDSVDNVLIS